MSNMASCIIGAADLIDIIAFDYNAAVSDFGIFFSVWILWWLMPKRQSVTPQEQLQSLLRLVRTEAGLTQTDVATRLEQPQSLVSKYESGERRLDILELREVCAASGMPLPEFIKRLEKVLAP